MLLRELGRRISSCLREMDTAARFGGDEFVLVVCELDKDRARSIVLSRIVAGKVRATVAEPYELQLPRENGAATTIKYQCTASIGVVMFINHETSHKNILDSADKAMYQAKAAGRNLIRFYAA